MAKIGLQGFWTGLYSESTKGTIVFTGGKKVAKAVQLNENRTVSNVSLYADDAKDDDAYAVTDVALSITPNGFSLAELQEIVGTAEATVTLGGASSTAMSATGFSNEGARRGIGVWCTESISGVRSYKVLIYPNTAFRPAESRELNTKGESISFATEACSGKAFADKSGNYVYEKQFSTQAEAETFLDAVFGVGTNTGIMLNLHMAEVAVNGSVTLEAATVPASQTVTWSSDDTDKATVTSGGVVEGVAAGTVTITASITVGGTDYTDSCVVRITAAD